MKLRFSPAAFLLILCIGAAAAAQTADSNSSAPSPALVSRGDAGEGGMPVRLAWDSSPDKRVAGYIIHYGVKPGKYTETVRVEGRLNTVADIKNLEKGKTYYFVVTAYNAKGKESAFSREVALNPVKALSSQGQAGSRRSPRVPIPSGDEKIPPRQVRTSAEGKMVPSR